MKLKIVIFLQKVSHKMVDPARLFKGDENKDFTSRGDRIHLCHGSLIMKIFVPRRTQKIQTDLVKDAYKGLPFWDPTKSCI